MDAAAFDFPPEPSVIFFFNPFSHAVMDRVVANLERSFEERPRDLYVVYCHPRPGHALTRLSFLSRITLVGANTDYFEVYRSTYT